MLYYDFHGEKISKLAFGMMRLPKKDDGEIDEVLTEKLVDRAILGGVNYFDTAYPYHNGKSEIVTGKLLAKYPRNSYFLASKYPGHQISDKYDPEPIFEEQLKKCGVEYFDFYLLHNVYENSMKVYTDEKLGIVDYFLEQKKKGRIRHLGFSTHARPDTLEKFLSIYGKDMEFCQIQHNYLDATLQRSEEKCAILEKHGIPIWVMEPVRGGKLASLDEESERKLRAIRPDESTAAWAFRFLISDRRVATVLSGMSDMSQLEDNLRTFSNDLPLSEKELGLLSEIAETLKTELPCTACRYCTDVCPASLDIPTLISLYNDIKSIPDGSLTARMQIESLPEDKRPSACLGCRACEGICPQKIAVSEAMEDLCRLVAKYPSWEQMCREREEAAKKLRG